MAGSFKKNLILKIAPIRKAAPKRQASHRVRHVDELASGAAYGEATYQLPGRSIDTLTIFLPGLFQLKLDLGHFSPDYAHSFKNMMVAWYFNGRYLLLLEYIILSITSSSNPVKCDTISLASLK